MFEKEAEEIANKRCHEIMCYGHCSFSSPKHHRCGEWHREYNCAKEGIEFGYNKANEWHKVADEGLPINKNDGATYLLYTIYGKGGSPVVAHFAYRDKQELMNVWTGAILTEDKIVVWKEIVLPKESE